MKKIYLTLAVALMLASCNEGMEDCGCDGELYPVSLVLSGGGQIVTKTVSVTEAQEKNISSSALYVYGKDYYDRYESDTGEYSFYLPAGTYDFVAVVNDGKCPDGEVSYGNLLSTKSSLSDNLPGKFVMTGERKGFAVNQSESLQMEVRRLLAKVNYSVSVDWEAPALSGKPFALKKAYLTNVSGVTDYAASFFPDKNGIWYNKMKYDADDMDIYLYQEENVNVADGTEYVSPSSFYIYPNTSSDTHDKSSFSPRSTRFVLEAEVDGRLYYYPVTIPKVERNKLYDVNIFVTAPGTDDPEDEHTSTYGAVVTIHVLGWEDGGTIQGRF